MILMGTIPSDCHAINVFPSEISFINPNDTCECLGGDCRLTGFSLAQNFHGTGQFQISFTDKDGTSAYETVTIEVQNIDDVSVPSGASVDLAAYSTAFVEDISKVVYLEYSDVEGDIADKVEITYPSAVAGNWLPPYTFAGSCSFVGIGIYECPCSTENYCSIIMQPADNYNTGNGPSSWGVENFFYRVKSNQLYSSSFSVNYGILPLNDAPAAGEATVDTFLEDDKIARDLILNYFDVEGENATSCSVSETSSNIQVNSCICANNGLGQMVCTANYQLATGHENENSPNQSFYFKYQITDDGMDNGYILSSCSFQ